MIRHGSLPDPSECLTGMEKAEAAGITWLRDALLANA